MRSTERILTTHTGSLPKPDDLVRLLWAKNEGEDVDEAALEARIAQAVKDLVAQQAEVGIDIVSDGEASKPGFSTYIYERYTGFGEEVEPRACEGLRGLPGARRARCSTTRACNT